MTVDPSFILDDARWLLHRYDARQDAFQFQNVDRRNRNAAPFLTDQDLKLTERPVIIARADTARQAASAPLHFLFHSGFCSSTMLVKALDMPGTATGLSEPVVLNDLVGIRRRGEDSAVVGSVTADALRLLARGFETGEAVIVKPSNILNPRLDDLMREAPGARALLLYAPLEDFLLSVARKGLWCRLWVRQLLGGYRQDTFLDFGFSDEDLFLRSDLQIAAIGWLAQQQHFAASLAHMPGRLRSLDSRTLNADPVAIVCKAARFFGLEDVSADTVRAHPALARDSKTGSAYSREAYEAAIARVREAHEDEIAKVTQWGKAVADTFAIPMDLPWQLT